MARASRGSRTVGTFRVNAEIAPLSGSRRFVQVQQLLVDTGSELSWVPAAVLAGIGVKPSKKDVPFLMANGTTITRQVGYVRIRAEGFETVDEVVFGQAGDLALIGARTLEGFGAVVDARRRRLVAAGPHPVAMGLGA